MDAKKSSLKMNVGSSPWLSCNGILSEPKKCSANNNLKISDHFVNGMGSEAVVDELFDALAMQQLALEDARAELVAEREASAVGIENALNMISQLQQEKSSLTLEHTSYYRETEIRLAFAQQKLSYYEDLLEEKNKEIRLLQDELRTYRTEEERVDRDVDFPLTSLFSHAPPDNFDFTEQRSCSENSLSSENHDSNNSKRVDHNDAQLNDNTSSQNQIGPLACNTHTTVIRRLTELACGAASSVKDIFSMAAGALWSVCLFLFIGSQKS